MITTMKFAVTGQRIELAEPVMLVAETVHIYTASFVFNSTWDGYTKMAVFRGGDVEREQLLTDDSCEVPWEVLLPGAYLEVGVYGTKGGSRLPTIWTSHRQYIHDGAGPTDEAADPSPVLAEQILQRMGDLGELKTEDKSSLVAAINEVRETGGGGTADHSKLKNRDAADQHPIGAITGLKEALDDKQPAGDYLTQETDPTVPSWAKAAQKPPYTASEVGADPYGTADAKVAAHNTGTDTHSDIRLLIQGLTDRLNALADSDDTTLDQLSEIVAYIKSNRDLISAITTDKVSVADIVDDLVTNVADKPLSAAQGVALKALIDAISIPEKLPNPNALTFTGAVEGSYDGSEAKTINIPSGGASGDYIPVPATAEVGQTVVVKAVDENGKPTEWEAADMEASVDIDISRAPDLIIEVAEAITTLSISEINGVPINTTEMVVLWEHPGGGKYIPNYFRFNNEVRNGTDTTKVLANWNLLAAVCPTTDTAAAILSRVKKVNNGVYYYEFSGLQQNAGTITGVYNPVYGAPYSNILDGETSIKEFFVYQSTQIQPGCKVSVWVK